MAQVTGTVEQVSTQYGKYSIKVDGMWYGTKEEWAKVKPDVGQEVSFDDGGGKFTKNVRILSGPPGAHILSSDSATRSETGLSPAKVAPPGRSFPVAALAPERTINRQNALTAAVNFMSESSVAGGLVDEMMVIKTARLFEAYTTGDLDLQEAKDAMDQMTETSH